MGGLDWLDWVLIVFFGPSALIMTLILVTIGAERLLDRLRKLRTH